MDFGGTTFDRSRDGERLDRQLQTIRELMRPGTTWTLRGIELITGFSQASISARIRDLRKPGPKFPGWTIEREYLGGGLWAYHRVLPEQLTLEEGQDG